jgi:hypothetical protein
MSTPSGDSPSSAEVIPFTPKSVISPFSKGSPTATKLANFTLLDNLIRNNTFQSRSIIQPLFTKIVRNILLSPSDPKYRKLNKEKIVQKLNGQAFTGLNEFMKALGFIIEDGSFWVLPEVSQNHMLILIIYSISNLEY